MALLAGSASAWAIGLGEAQVMSRLGEPLEVEIPIVTGTGERPRGITVEIPPEHRPVGVRELRVVVEEAQGLPVRVRLRTREGHREPVVVLRLRLRSSSAEIDREYTLIIDPPATVVQPAAAAPALRQRRETALRAAQKPTTLLLSQRPAASRALTSSARPAPEAPRPLAQSTDLAAAVMPRFAAVESPEPGLVLGPVLPGDTLYAISARVAAERGVDRRSVASAILAANPRAFPDGRPERLLAGAILAVPLSPQVLAGEPVRREGTAEALASSSPYARAAGAGKATAAAAPTRSEVAPSARTVGLVSGAELRERIAATRAAIAAEEARRETLAARLDRANARIEALLARQTELDQRQADLADAIASIETRARPVQSLAARVSPVRAAAASTLAPMAPAVPQAATAQPASTAQPAATRRDPAAASGGWTVSLPAWLIPSPVLALALTAALVAAGLGYRRWREGRDALALDRYRDDELHEAVKQRIADVRESFDRTLSEADGVVVVELEDERARRAMSA